AVREALQEELAGLVAQQLSVRDEVAVATLAHQQLASELAAAQESLTADEQIVTEACAEHESVAARRSALGAVRDALKAVADARIDARHCSVAESNAKAVLSETLASVGFSEVAAAEEAILDEAQYCSLKEAVELWDRQTAETAAALRELEAVDLEVCVDMEAQRAAAESARVLSREADGLVSRLADRLERGMPSREVVLRRLTELETVREQTEQVIRMADYATATRNEVTHKIRLSSFVLMRRFEDVVNAANDRLDTISEGRYQLVVETHGLDARSQAGLDVRVYDGRSDTHRSTKSLSGGERFYVSLALALGLADVVRSESGGVELGTLFIDEGFGSLDSEVLEEVMDMLEQVRVGEDRVIGLISHVEVLKQRIDPRISVRRDPERPGVSTAQVHL
ncbi:MAG: SbcC/MukB-like Walker B domain-containing protein, partial [Candidatus Nanopelagicales bacterium]